MRQCELEKIVFAKGAKEATRSGEKKVAMVDGIDLDMVGAVVELKKIPGLWVVDSVDADDVEFLQIKRNWHVGGVSNA